MSKFPEKKWPGKFDLIVTWCLTPVAEPHDLPLVCGARSAAALQRDGSSLPVEIQLGLSEILTLLSSLPNLLGTHVGQPTPARSDTELSR